jgi:DNA topoisomerase-2
VFVNCLIVNPSFDSQTKDYLTTVSSKFGSSFEFSDKFFKDLANTDIIKSIVNTYNFKENKGNKKNDGKKTAKLYGIPKLDDANWAGGRKSQECALFLTEGDSAATFAIAGLSVIGRDKYGVFPLRGKVINARDKITTQAGLKQVNANSELIHLKQILGLEQGKKYTDTSTLRYGKIIILTDQDLDGSHIKGLILNWVDTFWPDLLSKNFVSVFQTPIIKAKKGKQEEVFYSLKKFEDWKTTVENSTSFHTKYFKGLATSNTQEAKEYFKKLTLQTFNSSDNSKDAVDKAFNKNRADDRKRWLKKYDKNNIIDEEQKSVTCEEFIDKELIHFSNYDVQRSIPHLMDGLKPSQRKILFACFKRKLTKEIRVAQLAGYVSEHSGYHHGEASLNGAIIGMAQDFMGSNNINLLSPNGQFGSRIQNGKDAGSPRYIHTALTDISTKLYISSDEASLEFLEDDGLSIEPVYYAPVIPMILVNGSQGIGTGYSTSIPMFNPKDIFKQVRNKIDGKSIESLTPYYHGFKGSIVKDGNGFVTKGKYRQLNYKTLLIDELPIGTSIDEFKNFIDDVVMNLNDKKKKLDKKYVQFQGVKGYTSQSTESCVHFEIEFDPIVLQSLMKKVSKQKTSLSNDIEKMFKLASKVSTSNMHLFQTNGIIKKFKNTTEIIDSFYIERLRLYEERKKNLLNELKGQMSLLENKVRFLKAVINDDIIVRKLNKEELIDELTKMKFDKLNDNYNYLINIAIYKITKDEIKKLNDEFSGKTTEFELLSKTNIEDLWRSDLKVLELSLEKKYKSV